MKGSEGLVVERENTQDPVEVPQGSEPSYGFPAGTGGP